MGHQLLAPLSQLKAYMIERYRLRGYAYDILVPPSPSPTPALASASALCQAVTDEQ